MVAGAMSLLDEVLEDAFARYAQKRPNTKALHDAARHSMPGGNTRTVLYHAPFPIRVAHAEGSRLTDADGYSYVDYLGEYSAGIYGHSHPRIRAAVAAAMASGLNIGAHHAAEAPFAAALTRRFHLDLVRFTNSGTEANMMALGAARCFTGRDKILAFHGGYHGGTLSFAHGASPVNAPYPVTLARYNDKEGARAAIAAHGGELAAVIVEPMLGSAGCIPAERDFIAMLRQETDARGIVLIFDEVMTSRLGPHGLADELGIEPDLKTLGKYVGGGMSFGAFGGRRAIMEQFDPAREGALPHAGTFNNNALTMAAGLAGISEIYTAEACIELNARGERLKSRLNELFMHRQAPMRATGVGSLLAVHPVGGVLRASGDAEKADTRRRRLLFHDLLDEGLYIAERGFMALSLAITDEDCERLAEGMRRFVERRGPLLLAGA